MDLNNINLDNITYKELDIKHIELTELYYRMPQLFLDVIIAFNEHDTHRMQECCKKYLDITRKKENKNEIFTASQVGKVITQKNEYIINKNNKIIQLSCIISSQTTELEKLKSENTKLKQALKHFINDVDYLI